MLIAHRGAVGGTNIRENTLKAFSRIFSQNIDIVGGFECDLWCTKDNVVIVYHNDTILINNTETFIYETQYSDLPEYIPTLDELCSLIDASKWGGIINLEIKQFGIINNIHKILQNYPKIKIQIIITSFLHTEIDKFKQLDQNLSFGYICSCFPSNYLEILRSDSALIMSYKILPPFNTLEFSHLKQHCKKMFIYTVNNTPLRPKHVETFKTLGFNIITDFI